MPDSAAFAVFLTAAVILALTPGPGIFYVLARSLQGGRRIGLTSAFGTALGGLVHVTAAALGLSALLATSALAFSVVKYAGAAYLLYLGIRTLLLREAPPVTVAGPPAVARRAFYQGIATEVLNPKTALFFLAFIPQFINPHGLVVVQFLLLGAISVLLNTSADLLVVTLAGPIGQRLQTRPRFRRGQQMFSGCMLLGLGTYVALSGERS
jgi:threonine/homoserine/homoserine lactone efflux protein